MINYILQLNAFNARCRICGYSPAMRVVYYTLLDMNNTYKWEPKFKTTVRILADYSGISSMSTMHRAILSLVQEGLIQYWPSHVRGKKSTFSIVDLCSVFGTQTGTETGTQTGTETGTQTGTQTGTLNKYKYKEKNKAPTPKRFVPPTVDEVRAYCREKGLTVDPVAFIDYFTEMGWVDAKGNKVKSWKGKIQTWQKYQPKEVQQSSENRKIVEFTEEEEAQMSEYYGISDTI